MKTLAQMTTYVRRKSRDALENSPLWEDEEIQDEMAPAWEQVRRDLVSFPSGLTSLLVYQSAQSLVADQEEYALPANCLHVHAVQWRSGSDYNWLTVPFLKPPADCELRNGTSALLGFSQPACVTSGLGWFDDVDPGYVRIWPARTTVSGEQYRMRYVPKVPFPTADSATLRDPEETGADVYALPDGVDLALCFLTASMLALEELEDGKPIGVFGTLYSLMLRDIAGQARVLRPRTRHVGDR